ncbi:hypothetical protein CCHL11_02422 [Colletotrichum chlorophyti]|uniref:Uncharacterized protein n=1 Tax=Colletotrichum chlorophyti TaxID=708187 RepID=A0A1Q8S5T8_9PEZI|nr:hypothetical protein CCHL11_02422 [Colletotrichum chlorophyti]
MASSNIPPPVAASNVWLSSISPRSVATELATREDSHVHSITRGGKIAAMRSTRAALTSLTQGGGPAHKLIRKVVPPPKPVYPAKTDLRFRSGRHLLRRIGVCLAFGCNPHQTSEAARIVRTIESDWRRIQLTTNAGHLPEEAMYEHRLQRAGVLQDANGAPNRKPHWQNLTRHSPLLHIAEQSMIRFFEHGIATATPENQENWKVLREEGYPNRNEKHRHALMVHRAWLPYADPRVLEQQRVCAHTRIQLDENFGETGEVQLRTVIWSHRWMDRVAEAVSVLRFSQPVSKKRWAWLPDEISRLARLASDSPAVEAARGEYISLLEAVDELEKSTWNRRDAVEDFGTNAAPASEPAQAK